MNIPLPYSPFLPIHIIASSFDKVTNSYKFYWFLSILESVRNDEGRVLPVKTLLARMAAKVWYPINYFRLSFGKQDQLGNIVTFLMKRSGIAIDSPSDLIVDTALKHLKSEDEVGKKINKLADFVPYCFIRPFFTDILRNEEDRSVNGRIRELAEHAFESQRPCLYRFIHSGKAIEIHPDWCDYLKQHLAILTGFCLWHLINYLQKHNPNVPNITSKLFKSQNRDL